MGISDATFHRITCLVTDFIYSFHMPLFIALSGSLFALRKEQSLRTLVRKKAKRLLIPFFGVWLMWNIPIKFFTGYYDGVSCLKIIEQMAFPASVYLWYLEALFFIFLIAWVILKLNVNGQIIAVLLCWIVGVVIYQRYYYYHFLGDPLYYLAWFYIGYRMEDIKKQLECRKLWNGGVALSLLLCAGVLYLISHVLKNAIVEIATRHIVLPLFMCIALNYFARLNKGERAWKIYSSYSFGVYLYAEPLNYWLLYEFDKYMGLSFFGTETGAAIIYFSRLILTPTIAIGITCLLKKLNIRYLY